MNKVQLKDVQNVQFTNFARNFARVSINGQLKQIRFKAIKDDGKIKFIITKGLEYCIF